MHSGKPTPEAITLAEVSCFRYIRGQMMPTLESNASGKQKNRYLLFLTLYYNQRKRTIIGEKDGGDMKKRLLLPALLVCAALLVSCRKLPVETQPVTTASETILSQEEPLLPTEATAPLHSGFYIPGLSVEDVLLYFNEVCLNAEFINSGDPSYLQKWTEPVVYILYGEPTREDRHTLEAFAQWLNYIPDFPGIWETTDPAQATLSIHFCSQDELLALMGDHFQDVDGAVTFWYEDNEIYSAIICCRADIDQQTRNSVILEELYNGLGPIQDTVLRPDSILYADFSQPQDLTEIDELILQLLYHPDMKCGMNTAACEAVIRELYY